MAGRRRNAPYLLGLLAVFVAGCRERPSREAHSNDVAVHDSVPDTIVAVPPALDLLPGMPAILDTRNLYSAAGAQMLSAAVRQARALVYVPNGVDGTVSVIDPATYQVVRTFAAGLVPQHVVPAYDLTRLWVASSGGNTLIPIDPVSGEQGAGVPVDDPYNLYFTPDGRFALVIAERRQRLDFRDPQTMALIDSVRVDCKGVDHLEFTGDGKYALATCEFSGKLLKLDISEHRVVGYLTLDPEGLGSRAMPQDIRASPDGRIFLVADMMANGVWLVDPVGFKRLGFIATGKGTHGIYPSRDGRLMYIANRGWNTIAGGRHGPGSVTVLDPASLEIVATWSIPGGGSPDMGNITADGRELWLSGRYDNEVYVFDTQTGELKHRIKVGRGPHGLTVWPQPGRYSLGHTGNMR